MVSTIVSGRRAGGTRRALARLASDRQGAVAAEFAFILPVLILMVAGLIDLSRFVSQQMQVQSAAQAGAAHALSKGWSQADVAQAIVTATPLPISADPAPRTLSACASNATLVEVTGTTCLSGEPAGKYVLASARIPFRPLMPWPGIVLPQSIRGSALVRTQ